MNYPTKNSVSVLSLITFAFCILGIVFAFLLLYRPYSLTNYYDIIFNSDKEETNFLNLALSNLVPAHFSAKLTCIFVRSEVTQDIQGLNFGASIKEFQENRIVDSFYQTYSEKKCYFPSNSFNSSKFTLVAFPTDKIDSVKLQLSFTKPYGSLKGAYVEYSFISGSDPGITRPLSCSLSFIILVALFSYLHNMQDVSISDFYCSFLAFLGFLSLNPFILIQNSSKYTSFDDFSMPLFNNYCKFFILIQILELCNTIDTKTRFQLLLFFIFLFATDSIQGILKFNQIKNSSQTQVSISIFDIIYIVSNIAYIFYACRLFKHSLQNNLISFLLAVNSEEILISIVSIAITAMGFSFSMNGKSILTLANLLIASTCIFMMQKKKNSRRRVLFDNDEEPLMVQNRTDLD